MIIAAGKPPFARRKNSRQPPSKPGAGCAIRLKTTDRQENKQNNNQLPKVEKYEENDNSIEAMVSIHAVGNAENNYQDRYITRAYHIDGSGIAYECEGNGMLFDASKGWPSTSSPILRSRQRRSWSYSVADS